MRLSAFDNRLAIGLVTAFATALLIAQDTTGVTRDEGYYFRASRPYWSWWTKLASSPTEALKKESIDKHFKYNHEHPVLLKTLYGASEWLITQKLGLGNRIAARRLPSILFSAFTLFVIYRMGRGAHSPLAGAAAALLYATMPRVFFHSQLATFDAPIAFLLLAVTAAFIRTLDNPKSGLWCGFLFGFALATKLNSFFLPPVLAAWMLIFRRDAWRRGLLALALMGVIGTLVFYAHWPWIWSDTIERLRAYVHFHMNHPYYNTEYFGENYNRPPLPVSYPFVLTAFTVPLVTLLLGLAGAGLMLTRKAFNRNGALWVLSLLVPIVIIAHPTVPIFGGTKHWLTALPYLALLGGLALAEATKSLKPSLRAAVVATALLPGALQIAHAHPFGVSSYNALVGGVPGAADHGMLRQFWGYSTRPLLSWMNHNFPKDTPIYWHDTNRDSVGAYQREKLLRKDLRYTGLEYPAVERSNRALVVHELHFNKYEYMIWNAYGTAQPTKVLSLDGVPLVTVYARP